MRNNKRITTTVLSDVSLKKRLQEDGRISASKLLDRSTELFLTNETFALWVMGCAPKDKE